MHHNLETRVGCCISDSLVAVFCKLYCRVKIVATVRKGFVDKFQANDGVSVLRGAVFFSHGRKDGDRLLEIISLLPKDGTRVTRIVEAILGARLSVTIYPHLHAGRSCPANCLF